MTTNKRRDIFDEMTKDELVAWVRTRFILKLPKRSEILFIRWQLQSEALLDEQEKEKHSLDHLDFSERDRLTKMFNTEKNIDEKLRLLGNIRQYDEALKNHITRCKKLDAKWEKLDRMYEQINIERKREASNGND